MNDPRPAIAIGHVRLQVGNVATTTDFFVKLGIRTIVAQADFAVLELRGGTHLVLRPWEEPEGGPVPFDIMVDDIDAEFNRLKNLGVKFKAEKPIAIEAGVNKGGYTIYFTDIDGITLELIQPPP